MVEQQGRGSLKVLKSLKNSLLLTSYFLFLIFIIACGRRGDPVTPLTYTVGVVKDLSAVIQDNAVYLTWGMPKTNGFSKKTLKGFVIFRAEVPAKTTIEECKCLFRALDFIVIRNNKKFFEYLDKNTAKDLTYAYKIVVMDKKSIMGKDSNVVLVDMSELK